MHQRHTLNHVRTMESALPEIIMFFGWRPGIRIGDDPETFCPRRSASATVALIEYEFHGLAVTSRPESVILADVSAGVGLAHTTLRR